MLPGRASQLEDLEKDLSGSDLWVIFKPWIGFQTAFTLQSEQLRKADGGAGRSGRERARQLTPGHADIGAQPGAGPGRSAKPQAGELQSPPCVQSPPSRPVAPAEVSRFNKKGILGLGLRQHGEALSPFWDTAPAPAGWGRELPRRDKAQAGPSRRGHLGTARQTGSGLKESFQAKGCESREAWVSVAGTAGRGCWGRGWDGKRWHQRETLEDGQDLSGTWWVRGKNTEKTA